MKTQGENQQEFSERQEEGWRKRLKEFLEFSGEVPAKGGRLERILQDKAAVDVSELVDLLDWYRELNPTWLLTGKGWMIRSGHGNDILPGVASEGGLVEQMRKMVKEELKKAPPTIRIEKFAGKLDVSIPKEEVSGFESILAEALTKLVMDAVVDTKGMQQEKYQQKVNKGYKSKVAMAIRKGASWQQTASLLGVSIATVRQMSDIGHWDKVNDEIWIQAGKSLGVA